MMLMVLEVFVKIRYSKDMFVVWKFDEVGIFVFFFIKKDLGNRIIIVLFCVDSINVFCFIY